ncbi:MAG TPA: hypothetical protein V6D00_16120 [Pantanalinema sp.]
MTSRPDAASFAEALPDLFERVYAPETTYLGCVVALIDAIRAATDWDRAVYSEIRRHPEYSEVVYMSEAEGLPGTLFPQEIPCPNFSAVDFSERVGGYVEVAATSPIAFPPSLEIPPEILLVERLIQAFMRSQGIQRAVYAPKRLTPNFAPLITLHRCASDDPLSDADRETLKLGHIVLKEIVQRKRWRFRIPGHSTDHDRIMPMLAAGWDVACIAETLAIPLREVRAMRDHILIELENQYGIRTPEAAVIFLRGELAKPV